MPENFKYSLKAIAVVILLFGAPVLLRRMKLTWRLGLLLTLAMGASCGRVDSNNSTPASAASAPRTIPPTNRGESQSDTDLVREFVQEFYDWYVPISNDARSGRASDLALQRRPSAFDSSLTGQLREDSNAQAKVQGEIVGLDFDPFLASQDPCERYEVLNVRTKEQKYLVAVRGVGGCEKHNEEDVVAEVVSRNGVWLFANFHYPGLHGNDLLTILKTLRDARR